MNLLSDEFVQARELALAKQFEECGYVIVSCLQSEMFQRIRTLAIESVNHMLGGSNFDDEFLLDQIHEVVPVEELNGFRLNVINHMNAQPWFRAVYFNLARPALEALVGSELAMQRRINLSVQFPGDDSSLLPVHADVWSGDSPFEVVVWLPLVDCYKTKSMYLLGPEADTDLRKNFHQYSNLSSEELFQKIQDDVTWIEINAGQVLIFNQNLPHGNRTNEEGETRWSMNCRFKGVFTPYGDKMIGEFFEPITLKAASRIGMSYQFPRVG